MKNGMDMIEYIRRTLPKTELLAQLAEEASELAQAALKLRRVMDGRNVTPTTEDEAIGTLFEETGDVALCLATLNLVCAEIALDNDYITKKLTRWVTRLRGKKETTDD